MAEKYLYFRTQAVDGDDDASADSACWPASSFAGMHPSTDTALTLYFKSMVRGSGNEGAGDALANLDNNDSVVITLTTANTHLVAMQKITAAINSPGASGLIIVVNDDDETADTVVLRNSGIASCGTITVQAAYAN